ncbi:YihY/virulence factor BrkB family protein [Kitasatospora sp. NBC_01250]|uniref:YihY/virulence factor BrkB family protein n=1 Tax=Kitasatospora sp. NBC_01250 TaxID=2903571 RepID=UPI002E37D8D2|nr:YihY/virulence factor BrkB family protein [Kitasatospora sp. NBC_01250]
MAHAVGGLSGKAAERGVVAGIDGPGEDASASASREAPAWPAVYWAALRRTPVAVWEENLTDWAAALTYYTVLALFPVLLVVLSVFGLSQPASTAGVIGHIAGAAPVQSRELLSSALQEMTQQRSAAWLLTFFGTVGALWSGSSYLGVFRRALYAIEGLDSDRPVRRTAPRIVLTALVLVLLLVVSALALVFTGTLARRVGRLFEWGNAPIAVWDALRWPVLLIIAVTLVLVLYRSGPAVSRPVRRMAPGGALAVGLWLASSAGFALYASQTGTYRRLYGSLAGLVVFLVWLWICNLVLLIGAKFNAELIRPTAGSGPILGPGTRDCECRSANAAGDNPAPPG